MSSYPCIESKKIYLDLNRRIIVCIFFVVLQHNSCNERLKLFTKNKQTLCIESYCVKIMNKFTRLTREPPRVSHSDFNEFWPVVTAQCRDENPKRIWVRTASFKSYDRFTEFLAHSWIFARKTKQWNL